MIKIKELNIETHKDFSMSLTSAKIVFYFPTLRDRKEFINRCRTEYSIEVEGICMEKTFNIDATTEI